MTNEAPVAENAFRHHDPDMPNFVPDTGRWLECMHWLVECPGPVSSSRMPENHVHGNGLLASFVLGRGMYVKGIGRLTKV